MGIRKSLGVLLFKISKKLEGVSERLGVIVSGPTYANQSRTLIWGVIGGPFYRDDFDEDDLLDGGIDESQEVMLVVKLEEDGQIEEVSFWYETEEEAMQIVHYFCNNIEPLEVSL